MDIRHAAAPSIHHNLMILCFFMMRNNAVMIVFKCREKTERETNVVKNLIQRTITDSEIFNLWVTIIK